MSAVAVATGPAVRRRAMVPAAVAGRVYTMQALRCRSRPVAVAVAVATTQVQLLAVPVVPVAEPPGVQEVRQVRLSAVSVAHLRPRALAAMASCMVPQDRDPPVVPVVSIPAEPVVAVRRVQTQVVPAACSMPPVEPVVAAAVVATTAVVVADLR